MTINDVNKILLILIRIILWIIKDNNLNSLNFNINNNCCIINYNFNNVNISNIGNMDIINIYNTSIVIQEGYGNICWDNYKFVQFDITKTTINYY